MQEVFILNRIKMKKGNISKPSKIVEMTLIHPNAAGIDIGDTLHSVAVPIGRDTECVRPFGAFTCDLTAIVEWLKKYQIDTVAIESTGVYWKNLYNMLTQNNIEVYLCNARQTHNITGKKTYESDGPYRNAQNSCSLQKKPEQRQFQLYPSDAEVPGANECEDPYSNQ